MSKLRLYQQISIPLNHLIIFNKILSQLNKYISSLFDLLMVKIKRKIEGVETLQFAVYGGICAILGLLSLILLFIAVLECRPGIPNAIGRSIISIVLGLMAIHFGQRAKNHKQGIIVIFFGIVVLILVVILYIFGIIPCAM